MDHQILCAVRSYINLNKMVPSAQRPQASLQALCLLQVSITAKSGQIKTLHAPFPNISSAGNIMSGSIDLFKINIHLTQLSSIHAAADIDADDIRNRFIGDRHCGADRAALSGMYIGHDPYLRSCCEIMVTHSADLFDRFVLYNRCITDRRIYLSFDFNHRAAPFILINKASPGIEPVKSKSVSCLRQVPAVRSYHFIAVDAFIQDALFFNTCEGFHLTNVCPAAISGYPVNVSVT